MIPDCRNSDCFQLYIFFSNYRYDIKTSEVEIVKFQKMFCAMTNMFYM